MKKQRIIRLIAMLTLVSILLTVFVACGKKEGPHGDQGIQGEQGTQNEQGIQGEQGTQNDQGSHEDQSNEVIIGSDGLKYTLSSDRTYYLVSGIGTCKEKDIVIPSVYNNLPVMSIDNNAFIGATFIESISILITFSTCCDSRSRRSTGRVCVDQRRVYPWRRSCPGGCSTPCSTPRRCDACDGQVPSPLEGACRFPGRAL